MNPYIISCSDKVIEFRVFSLPPEGKLSPKTLYKRPEKGKLRKGVSMFVSRYKGGIALTINTEVSFATATSQ